jgi:hypothetical protein
MAALQLYTAAFVYIDGVLQAEESDVKITRRTNSNPSNSVAKGYSGESPGAGMLEISITSNCPAAGLEFDPGRYMFPVPREIELSIYAHDKVLVTKGFLVDDDFGHGVSSEAKLSFNFRGQPAQWE